MMEFKVEGVVKWSCVRCFLQESSTVKPLLPCFSLIWAGFNPCLVEVVKRKCPPGLWAASRGIDGVHVGSGFMGTVITDYGAGETRIIIIEGGSIGDIGVNGGGISCNVIELRYW